MSVCRHICAHTHAHTYTHTHSHTHTTHTLTQHIGSHSHTHSQTHTLILTLIHTLSHTTHILTITHCHPYSRTHTLTHSHPHTHIHSHTHTLSDTLTHTHTHGLPPSASGTLAVSSPCLPSPPVLRWHRCEHRCPLSREGEGKGHTAPWAWGHPTAMARFPGIEAAKPQSTRGCRQRAWKS